MAKLSIGGQAVIEGVMMRGPKDVAVAVRKADGTIDVDVKPVNSISDRYPILKKPLLRGVVALVESLMALTMVVSVALAVGLFIAIPTWSMRYLQQWTQSSLTLNLAEGFLRMGIFLVYIAAISSMEDIQRVFKYHGAEHKTIFTYEAGMPLTVENVRTFPRLHPRCGTNFLMIVMLISIFIFAFLGWPNLVERILSRIVLMPVVAGISYELIRFAGKNNDKPWVHRMILPGLLLQKLTTREPDDEMIEVAIASVKAVLPEEELQKVEMQVPDAIALQAPAMAETVSVPVSCEEKTC